MGAGAYLDLELLEARSIGEKVPERAGGLGKHVGRRLRFDLELGLGGVLDPAIDAWDKWGKWGQYK